MGGGELDGQAGHDQSGCLGAGNDQGLLAECVEDLGGEVVGLARAVCLEQGLAAGPAQFPQFRRGAVPLEECLT